MKRSSFFIASALLLIAASGFVSCGKLSHSGQAVVEKQGETYRGGFANGKRNGFGQLSRGDSIVYSGQWKNGLRNGKGIIRDSLGRTVTGLWRNDTLVSATIADSTGAVYSGEVNRSMEPNGRGNILTSKHEYYSGGWTNGRRDGFGFAVSPSRHLRVGEWKAGRFLGERLQYTPDRIYGIDISRFQHDIGRRHYPIHWDKVRIVHLGSLSRKNVSGRVDYPISFCYIKSTEGSSLRNRYYRSDYHAARRQGIHVGSYHFFSTRTPASAQANFFIRHSIFSKGDFPPVLDLEPTRDQITRMGGPYAMFRAVRTWLRLVERRTGVKPVLYVGQGFVNRYLPLAPDIKRDYNIWIARYGEYKPDVHLVFWQLCPDGRVRGITPKVDINVFNGYKDEFQQFMWTERIK